MTVIIPKHFQGRIDAERLESLKDQGVSFEDASGIDALPLSEVQYGEELLGVLTEEECSVFVAFYSATEKMTELDREIGGGVFEQLGKDIRSGRIGPNVPENGYSTGHHVAPELAKQYFAIRAQSEMLRSYLFYVLGEKYGTHDFSMGIRSKRRVVKVKRKY